MSLLRLWLFLLFSLNPAAGLFCWHLPHEHRANKDLLDRNDTLLEKLECPHVERPDGPIYGCMSRADKGEVRMSCLDQRDEKSVKLCEKAVDSGKMQCNYNTKMSFGYGHTDYGHGICCCPRNMCNVVPPYWLITQEEPSWRTDIDNVCFIIVVVTIMTLLVAMEAVIEVHVRTWWAKRQQAALKKEEAATPNTDSYISVRDALDEEQLLEAPEVTSKNNTDPKQVDKKPASSNGVNGTQSSHVLDLPLDKTPETTPEGMKPSVVLDKTQPTTRPQRKSNIKSSGLAKKSPSGPVGQLKKSTKRKSALSTQKQTSTTALSCTDITQPETK